jgi:N-acetylmuramoyl-L-alanine amidase
LPKATIVLPQPALIPAPSSKTENKVDGQLRARVPKFRLVLDAGHGGWDLGTVGRKGLMEKDLVLDVVRRLGKLVEDRLGAEVIYTRRDDTYLPLEKRTEIANLAQADLFVSVHANYSDDSAARGAETYYTNTYSSVRARTSDADAEGTATENVNWTNVDIREKVQKSRRFAVAVQRALYGVLASQIPDMRNRGVKKATYVVLTGTSMPAILSEVSFVSSPADEAKLKNSSYRDTIAEGLFKGIAQYASTSHRVNVASAAGKHSGL